MVVVACFWHRNVVARLVVRMRDKCVCSDRSVVLKVVRMTAVRVFESSDVTAKVLLAEVEVRTMTWPVLWTTLMKLIDA